MIDETYTPDEVKRTRQQISDAEINPSVLDVMKAGFQEGWEAGPTKALSRFFTQANSPKDLSGEEANTLYNLEGTEIAYKPEERVSSAVAEIASERYFERRANEALVEQASKESPFLAPTANILGNIGAGAVDPTNLVIGLATAGVGSSLTTARMGAITAKEVTKQVAKQLTWGSVFKKQLAENFAASVITDALIVPLGEDVIREKVSTEQRVFNIIGSTLIGGALGTAMEAPAIARARRAANKMTNQHGSLAETVVEEANTKAMNDVAMNTKPNPDHVVKLRELEIYGQRPGQTEYRFNDLNDGNIKNQTFYIARKQGDTVVDQDSIIGDNSLFIIDQHNVAHNRVASIRGEHTGEVFELKLSEDSRIVTDTAGVGIDLYHELDPDLNFKKLGITEDDFELRDFGETIDLIHDKMENFKDVPNIDNLFNEALARMGYDGYLRVKTPVTQPDMQYNGVVLFDRNAFTIGDGFHSHNEKYISRAIKASDAVFDPDHPQSQDYLKQFRDLEVAEQQRVGSVESDLDYNEAAVAELDREKRPYSMEQEEYQKVLDDEALSEDEIELLKEDPQTAEIMKRADRKDYENESIKAFHACRVKRNG